MSTVTVTIHFANGSHDQHPFPSFIEARDFYRNRICYSNRVSRVTVADLSNSARSVWDASWDDLSKYHGLND
ncbi:MULTISPECIES: hypothetical protein [unclassified Bradyrhizobium]|uniref:hypothetical protein n=1 Tax=unclassified Bradyrhizobium TaxID=2631580 RepID=UPI0028E2C0C8|nr:MULTISPECIES: hypothetical protein [unclassified Bradyrhizobium]